MIENWITKFKDMWLTNNLDYIDELFTKDVDYWETPFKKLESLDDIKNEWQAVTRQQNTKLNLSLLSSSSDINVVKWDLNYETLGINSHWSGVYIIKFNETSGLCNYFLQVGEKE